MQREFPDLSVTAPEVTAEELKERIDAGESVTVLDTRRYDEFEQWHITGPTVTAVNVPFTAFLDEHGEPAETMPEAVPEGPLVTCCAEGISSLYVAEWLQRHGHEAEALVDGMEGWARLYEAFELPCDAATVVQYHRPSSGCLAYMVVSEGEAAVVDPLRAFVSRYERDALDRGAEVVAALDTHVHADHVSGARALADLTGADVVLPAGAVDRGLAYEAAPETVADGDAVPVGAATVEAVALPGHTTEMTGYRVGDLLLVGDTVFLDGVARPDLEVGDEGAADAARRLHRTLTELASLPDEVRIGPGHASPDAIPDPDVGLTATVMELREDLDLFVPDDREAFVDRITTDMPPRPKNYREIIATNLGRRDVDSEEAFELELGPNNCAVSG